MRATGEAVSDPLAAVFLYPLLWSPSTHEQRQMIRRVRRAYQRLYNESIV